ncbi:Type IV secretory system Conjugative DNA transfer [Bradyrhizobium sp. Rc2d]|nr:Type IV secretory system Conjugative DNA transfer [Bradyrhizobium sp. Rc2d]
MSFLGLYRDPVVAEVTRRCDWRISDIVGGDRATTLYLVVPPSDINRTKRLIRLILNQIGRRLTEHLQAKARRRRLLLMLDDFLALGRLDFFESALAFMAGYGIKSFLIAQSLNQIKKVYGPNNSILDNCHVQVPATISDCEAGMVAKKKAQMSVYLYRPLQADSANGSYGQSIRTVLNHRASPPQSVFPRRLTDIWHLNHVHRHSVAVRHSADIRAAPTNQNDLSLNCER